MAYKKTLTLGAIIIALVAVIGIAASSFAASDTAVTNNALHCAEKRQKNGLHKNVAPDNEKRLAVDAALAKADYQAWLTAVGTDSQRAKIISADKFPRLVEAYKIQQAALSQLQAAKKIREELGLPITPGPKGQRGHLIGNDLGGPSPANE